jgi:hypothetical protein
VSKGHDAKALAAVVMGLVFLIGGYAVALILTMFFYAMGIQSPNTWNWHTVFVISYWLFFAEIVAASLFLAYQWAAYTLDKEH